MRVKTYKEAVRLANSAGLDAAKRRMSKAGRKVMSAADFDHAAAETERILAGLGFDVAGWVAMAGVPRNEPPPPVKSKGKTKAKRSSRQKPAQLSFAFG